MSATAIYLIHFAVIWVVLAEFSSAGRRRSIGTVLAWSAIVFPTLDRLRVSLRPVPGGPMRRWAHRFGRRAQDSERAAGVKRDDRVPAVT